MPDSLWGRLATGAQDAILPHIRKALNEGTSR